MKCVSFISVNHILPTHAAYSYTPNVNQRIELNHQDQTKRSQKLYRKQIIYS